MCPWASRPRVIRPRKLVLCFLYLEMEIKFSAFQTWKWADEAVLGALKQEKKGLCVWGWEKGSWGWEGVWSRDQVLVFGLSNWDWLICFWAGGQEWEGKCLGSRQEVGRGQRSLPEVGVQSCWSLKFEGPAWIRLNSMSERVSGGKDSFHTVFKCPSLN